MHARVTQVHILPGKLTEFLAAVDSLRPAIPKQAGFRTLLVLCSAETPASENATRETSATIYSVWDTMEDLRASEKNLFLYQALAQIQSYCKGLWRIREEEVIASEMGTKVEARQAGE